MGSPLCPLPGESRALGPCLSEAEGAVETITMWELLRGHVLKRSGVRHGTVCAKPKVASRKPRLQKIILERRRGSAEMVMAHWGWAEKPATR